MIIDTGNVIINSGLFEAGAGGTLQINDNVSNFNLIEALNGGTVALIGETVTNSPTAIIQVNAGGHLDLETASISGGIVNITGALVATGTAAITGADVTNTGHIEVAGALTLGGELVSNSGGHVQVDGGDTLTLSAVTISGGTINNDNSAGGGIIHITGATTIDDGASLNQGAVTVDAAFTLDHVTINGAAIANNAGITLEDNVTLKGGASVTGKTGSTLLNTGTLEVAGAATLSGDMLTNAGATVQVDSTDTLTITATTINGGTINLLGTGTSAGTIDVTGASTIGNASIHNGNVTVEGVKLTLDNDTTVTGTTFSDTASGSILSVDVGETLTLNGVVVDGGELDVGIGATLDLINTDLFGVSLSDLGTINVSGTSIIDAFKIIGGQTTVLSGQVLVLDDALLTGNVTDDGTLRVDAHNTSVFTGLTITGGAITNAGIIDVTGTTEIEGLGGPPAVFASLGGSGSITIGAQLTLDNVALSGNQISETTGGSIVLNDTVQLTGGVVISGVPITNNNTLETTGVATLSDDGVNNAGNIEVLAGTSLTLNLGTQVNGGGSQGRRRHHQPGSGRGRAHPERRYDLRRHGRRQWRHRPDRRRNHRERHTQQ